MDRLTFDGNFCDISVCAEMPCKCKDKGCSQKQVWERLKTYENAEEHGRLIILPCKVGDTLYVPNQFEYTVIGFYFHEGSILIDIDHRFELSNGIQKSIIRGGFQRIEASDIGKEVFLTREEAEAALRKEQQNV